ncbi:MAG: tetratricopeptide repeat protein [Candidatus Eremiobacteraeota bacterium]|nr:tetratricopeptide repeat protein [Candidatus Eremiobacteraeota bacterium]
MKKALLTALLVLILSSQAFAGAGEADRLFQEGNEAYRNGTYQKAIECYLKITAIQQVASPQLYYNLGNAYFRDNKLGYAILYYEKAHRLLPRDRDIAFNLEFAREAAQKAGAPEGKEGASILSLASINEVTVAVFLLWWGLVALIILYVFLKKEQYLWALCTVAILFLMGTALMATAIYQREYQQSGIITAPSAEVHSSPSLQEAISVIIPEGTKVRILRTEEDWVEVAVQGQKDNASTGGPIQGWIPAKDIKSL